MTTTLREMMDRLPAERRERIEAQARELIAEEMTLRELRKALAMTQERLAQTLNIGQDSVSRLEQRSDLLLSTLRSYVEGMGGSLQLIVSFPDRKPVQLTGLAGLSPDAPEPQTDRGRTRRRRAVAGASRKMGAQPADRG